jgi:hypothetical protein
MWSLNQFFLREKHQRLPFGTYLEAHEDQEKTNTMDERTRGTKCLGLTVNFQGSYKLMCIHAGNHITRKQVFKELSMPQSVIK